MPPCVIFNPAARGNKAARFRRWLSDIGQDCVLKPTTKPGVARTLATEAVNDGFDTIVAAGGDGTVNEVLNGLVDAPDGLKRARLAVLPLGTVNVFAHELNMPQRLPAAWAVIQQGREIRYDLPRVEFQQEGKPVIRYFIQLAGAGLDARAIERVSWNLKKKAGPLAYIAAGLQAMGDPVPEIQVRHGSQTDSAQLVLIGNGKFYGGRFMMFPQADLRDGHLHGCLFPNVNWSALLHCGASLVLTSELPQGRARHVQADTIELSGPLGTPFQVDGEWCGHLPATFSLQPQALRVVVP